MEDNVYGKATRKVLEALIEQMQGRIRKKLSSPGPKVEIMASDEEPGEDKPLLDGSPEDYMSDSEDEAENDSLAQEISDMLGSEEDEEEDMDESCNIPSIFDLKGPSKAIEVASVKVSKPKRRRK